MLGRYARLGKNLNDHDCGNARDGFTKTADRVVFMEGGVVVEQEPSLMSSSTTTEPSNG